MLRTLLGVYERKGCIACQQAMYFSNLPKEGSSQRRITIQRGLSQDTVQSDKPAPIQGVPSFIDREGYLAQTKAPPPRILPWVYAEGPIVFLGGWRFLMREVPM